MAKKMNHNSKIIASQAAEAYARGLEITLKLNVGLETKGKIIEIHPNALKMEGAEQAINYDMITSIKIHFPKPTLSDLIEHLKSQIVYYENDLRSWVNKMSEGTTADIVYQLEWGQNQFETSGRFFAWSEALAWINNSIAHREEEKAETTDEQILEAVIKAMKEECLRRARWPERSTSRTSSEISLCKNAGRAELLEKLESFLREMAYDIVAVAS